MYLNPDDEDDGKTQREGAESSSAEPELKFTDPSTLTGPVTDNTKVRLSDFDKAKSQGETVRYEFLEFPFLGLT